MLIVQPQAYGIGTPGSTRMDSLISSVILSGSHALHRTVAAVHEGSAILPLRLEQTLMASPRKTPPRLARSTITIERMPSTYGTALLGAFATQVLASVDGVSAVRIEDQYVDLAMLSYEWTAPASDSTGIDRSLWSKGMRRVG